MSCLRRAFSFAPSATLLENDTQSLSEKVSGTLELRLQQSLSPRSRVPDTFSDRLSIALSRWTNAPRSDFSLIQLITCQLEDCKEPPVPAAIMSGAYQRT